LEELTVKIEEQQNLADEDIVPALNTALGKIAEGKFITICAKEYYL
jgi:hypothetical protein